LIAPQRPGADDVLDQAGQPIIRTGNAASECAAEPEVKTMREFEHGAPEHARPRQDESTERAEVGREAADAARAITAGRPEAVRPAAMLHLQRAVGNAGVAAMLEGDQDAESPVKDVVGKGSGQPLDAPVRQRMEASFGADFSDVRVHSGGSAAASAQAMDAHAYTVGSEIVLGDGQTPGSPTHERTLAHELSHVVQQRSGPVDGTPAAGGISVSDPADRFERAAETTADAVLSTGRAPDAGATGVTAGGSVQREELPGELPEEEAEEEEVQELAIQRVQREEEEERLLL
jgi:hypothetical protein